MNNFLLNNINNKSISASCINNFFENENNGNPSFQNNRSINRDQKNLVPRNHRDLTGNN